jgi:hypothetical protein
MNDLRRANRRAANALRFLIFTVARTNEIVGARWRPERRDIKRREFNGGPAFLSVRRVCHLGKQRAEAGSVMIASLRQSCIGRRQGHRYADDDNYRYAGGDNCREEAGQTLTRIESGRRAIGILDEPLPPCHDCGRYQRRDPFARTLSFGRGSAGAGQKWPVGLLDVDTAVLDRLDRAGNLNQLARGYLRICKSSVA